MNLMEVIIGGAIGVGLAVLFLYIAHPGGLRFDLRDKWRR